MIKIRRASLDDAEAIAAIYKPYCQESTISFEYEAPDQKEIENRINKISLKYPWLVAEVDNNLAGYAYASNHRHRDAYKWSVETSIYLEQKYQGQGIGRLLYEKLLQILKKQGFVNAYAGIGHPNDASIAFHKSLGFEEIGVYKRVGYKFNTWWDVSWWHLSLQSTPPDIPSEPRSVDDCLDCLT